MELCTLVLMCFCCLSLVLGRDMKLKKTEKSKISECPKPDYDPEEMPLNGEIPNTETLIWKRRCGGEQDKYVRPQGTSSEEMRFVKFKMTGEKRDIYSISDTHIGAYIGKGSPDRLLPFLDHLAERFSQVHSLVLLGDIFDMWYEPVNRAPLTASQLVENIMSGDIGGVENVIDSIRVLAEELDINVFYIRGNHDYQLTEDACFDLFGPKVEFIEGTLVMEIEEEGNHIYRIRYEHGHNWDLFNSYALSDIPGGLLSGNQVWGHYLSRIAATDTRPYDSYAPSASALRNASVILEMFGFDILASFVVNVLALDTVHSFVMEHIAESIVNWKNIHLDEKFIINETGHYVTFGELLARNPVKHFASKFGADHVFDMIKHSVGDHSDFLLTCAEDVVVLGHSDVQVLRKMPGVNGMLIHANGGQWHDYARETSFIKITPPYHNGSQTRHGKVTLHWAMLD